MQADTEALAPHFHSVSPSLPAAHFKCVSAENGLLGKPHHQRVCSLHTVPSCAHRTHTLTHAPHTELHTHAHMHLTGSLPHIPTQLHPLRLHIGAVPSTLVHSPSHTVALTHTQLHAHLAAHTHSLTLLHTSLGSPQCVSLMHKACTRSSLGAHGQHNEGNPNASPRFPSGFPALHRAWPCLASPCPWAAIVETALGGVLFFGGAQGATLQMRSEEVSHRGLEHSLTNECTPHFTHVGPCISSATDNSPPPTGWLRETEFVANEQAPPSPQAAYSLWGRKEAEGINDKRRVL